MAISFGYSFFFFKCQSLLKSHFQLRMWKWKRLFWSYCNQFRIFWGRTAASSPDRAKMNNDRPSDQLISTAEKGNGIYSCFQPGLQCGTLILSANPKASWELVATARRRPTSQWTSLWLSWYMCASATAEHNSLYLRYWLILKFYRLNKWLK